MKLYLSSYRLGANPKQLRELVADNTKAGVVSNALDFWNDTERRQGSIRREIADLESLGLDVVELDLRNYFESSETLLKRMSDFGLLWVTGGNSFILRRAMKQSGLDQLLLSYQSEGKRDFVYAGYSAGAVVVTPTLRGIELVDEPHVVPDRYDPEIIWEGLGLVAYSIAPHYRSNHPESAAIEYVVEYFERHGMPFKALADGEVDVVSDSHIER